MTIRKLVFVVTLAFVVGGDAITAEKGDVKSGPQAGDKLPSPFQSVVVHSGEPGLGGKRNDFVEMYGANPVVLIFAREMSFPLTSLVRRLDVEAAGRKSVKLRILMVILSDKDAVEKNLKEFGEKEAIKRVHLAIMEPDGPKHYKLSKEADVTVVMYQKQKVEANHAFKKGELNEQAVEQILADIPKIIPKQ